MKKIIDNSVISAIGKNIRSVELMPILLDRYGVVVPRAVVEECWKYEDGRLIPLIESTETADDPRIARISSILKRYYQTLGSGEISCIATALVLTADDVPNYLVLDDRVAKNIAAKVGKLQEIRDVLDVDITLNITGTVGLVLHLNRIDAISDREKQNIGYDLEKGDFRLSKELLNLLR